MYTLKISNLTKSYYTKNKKIEVLNNISFEFESGKFYVIRGHSGSGKSTLINILGLLLKYDTGDYYIYDEKIDNINSKKLCEIRNKNIGFIFQNYNLSNTLKAYENVILPMMINNNIQKNERKKIARDLLTKVGLVDRYNHFPKQLSGGEQQRVAIARALANNPNIILADEPTGNLDKTNEEKILKILKSLAKENKCVIVVSHSSEINSYADVILELDNGSIKRIENEKKWYIWCSNKQNY